MGDIHSRVLTQSFTGLVTDNEEEIDFYVELFNRYIREATNNNTEDLLRLIVREEIKEYLRKNPEAIQIKKIARRNMSPN